MSDMAYCGKHTVEEFYADVLGARVPGGRDAVVGAREVLPAPAEGPLAPEDGQQGEPGAGAEASPAAAEGRGGGLAMSAPNVDRYRRIEERRHQEVDGWRTADDVARLYGVSLRALIGPCRARLLVAARAEVAVRLRSRGWTLAEIGELLGSRHHTTVMSMLEAA